MILKVISQNTSGNHTLNKGMIMVCRMSCVNGFASVGDMVLCLTRVFLFFSGFSWKTGGEKEKHALSSSDLSRGG
ncbi:MAG: hypothetical protein ACOC4C_03850 [Fibrobacterota bacterium]